VGVGYGVWVVMERSSGGTKKKKYEACDSAPFHPKSTARRRRTKMILFRRRGVVSFL